MKVRGIHHISSVVGQAQRNVDFYSGFLGLRLVKNTLNYDDKETFHFYYGNKDGSTGLVTTFPLADAMDGVIGGGQVGSAVYAIPRGSMGFWEEHLNRFNISYTKETLFGEVRLQFTDLDELSIELVETDYESKNPWSRGDITEVVAFQGIESAVLNSLNPKATQEMLETIFGYELSSEDEGRLLFKVNNELGGQIELIKNPVALGRSGKGVVHHIALGVENGSIETWRQRIIDAGYSPTEVKDRFYFQSIYFREHGGILIEIATAGPGVLIDETVETLGSKLIIPNHYLKYKEEIEAEMMPIFIRDITKFLDYGYRNRTEYDLLQEKKALKDQVSHYIKLSKERPLTDEEKEAYNGLRRAYLQLGKKGN